jgi:hypothetical protein
VVGGLPLALGITAGLIGAITNTATLLGWAALEPFEGLAILA